MKPKKITERQLTLLAGFVRDDGCVWSDALMLCSCSGCLAGARSVHRAKLAVLEFWPDGKFRLRLTDIGKLALVEAGNA